MNNRELEEWELAMLVDGEGTAEMARALADSPTNQARLAHLRAEQQLLAAGLYRVECPPALWLGEWHLGLLDAAAAEAVHDHLALCDHCQGELAEFAAMLSQPIVPPRETAAAIKRVVMRLMGAIGGVGGGTALPALRGSEQPLSYSGDSYMLSMSRQEGPTGLSLTGSILSLDPEGTLTSGQARLRQGAQVIYESSLTTSATFAFDGVSPGCYELLIVLPQTELVVPDLTLEG